MNIRGSLGSCHLTEGERERGNAEQKSTEEEKAAPPVYCGLRLEVRRSKARITRNALSATEAGSGKRLPFRRLSRRPSFCPPPSGSFVQGVVAFSVAAAQQLGSVVSDVAQAPNVAVWFVANPGRPLSESS